MQTALDIVAHIKKAQNIVITSHKSPDGDSVGSSLAMYELCVKLGKQPSICHPDPAPKFLQWLPNSENIKNLEEHSEWVKEQIKGADLLFSLDYNDPSRTGVDMETLIRNCEATKIVIDHHLNPSDFADILMSDTKSCSTCQMLYNLMEQAEILNLLDAQIGTPMYLGIMTDSGSFRYNSVQPKTHEIAAHLLKAGVKNDDIHEQVFDVNTLDKIKLRSFACVEKLVVLDQYKVAYLSLSLDELSLFTHEKGDTEGLVNIALSIQGIQIAAFFMETTNGVKISFRSKGKEHPVNQMAEKYFGGGGHANAAGGFFTGQLEEAIKTFIEVVPNYAL